VITDHRFVGLRQWGIYANPNRPCQAEGCGQPKSQHAESCNSVLMIKGEAFPCDMVYPHHGWAHSNGKAEAIWGEGSSLPVH
jgi:hypothetical protein